MRALCCVACLRPRPLSSNSAGCLARSECHSDWAATPLTLWLPAHCQSCVAPCHFQSFSVFNPELSSVARLESRVSERNSHLSNPGGIRGAPPFTPCPSPGRRHGPSSDHATGSGHYLTPPLPTQPGACLDDKQSRIFRLRCVS